MLEGVVTGVLTSVITAAGRRVAGAAHSLGTRKYREDLDVARWFNTYQLTVSVPDLHSQFSGVTEQILADCLAADGCHAVLHELLAARLIGAPDRDVGWLRDAFVTEFRLPSGTTTGRALADILFDYFDEEICCLVGRLEGALPGETEKLRTGAIGARIIAILNAMERHMTARGGRPDPQVVQNFISRYRRHAVAEYGMLEPPDFQRRLRVPLDELHVAPQIFSITDDPDSDASAIDNWKTLPLLADRFVLLGDPGCGKTTTARALAYAHAADPSLPVPFLVTVRDFAASRIPVRSVLGHIEYTLDTIYQCSAPAGLLALLFLDGAALVVFDSFDELVDTAARARVAEIIEHFCLEYPLAPVMVTSRAVGYDEARLDDRQFARYRIGQFTDAGVAEYAVKWFSHQETLSAVEAEEAADDLLRESEAAGDLRGNPLMLALMCILYRGVGHIPLKRADIYAQCADLLFNKWDARRKIYVELRAQSLIEPALRHLAFWLFTKMKPSTVVTEHQLITETAEFLYRRGFETREEAVEAATEFVAFCRGRAWVFSDMGASATGEVLYGFTHRTFLEFFTAAYLAAASDTPEQLAEKLDEYVLAGQWDIVAELAIQMKDHSIDRGAERAIRRLLSAAQDVSDEPDATRILNFVAGSVGSFDLPPEVIRDLTRRVLNHMFLRLGEIGSRSSPVGVLLSCCWMRRDLVRDEILARIERLISSNEEHVRTNGLRLGMYLAEVANAFSRRRDNGDNRLANYWHSVVAEHCARHGEAVVLATQFDRGLFYFAIQYRLMSLTEALRIGDGLDMIFGPHPLVIFDGAMGSRLNPIVGELIGIWDADAEGYRYDRIQCAEFGRFMLQTAPSLPWAANSGLNLKELRGFENAIPLTEEEYLGAAIAILAYAEGIQDKGVRIDLEKVAMNSFDGLLPYIRLRFEARRIGSQETLPSLPVRSDFQKVFREWAHGKVSFIARHGN